MKILKSWYLSGIEDLLHKVYSKLDDRNFSIVLAEASDCFQLKGYFRHFQEPYLNGFIPQPFYFFLRFNHNQFKLTFNYTIFYVDLLTELDAGFGFCWNAKDEFFCQFLHKIISQAHVVLKAQHDWSEGINRPPCCEGHYKFVYDFAWRGAKEFLKERSLSLSK